MIREINRELNESAQMFTVFTESLTGNSATVIEQPLGVVLESAETFLATLSAKLANGASFNAMSNNVRNTFGILAALDLLRHSQPRKVVGCNSLNMFLKDLVTIDRGETLNQVEVRLLHSLDQMKGPGNRTGLSLRDDYLDLATHSPEELLPVVKKLQSQYQTILAKLKTAVGNEAPKGIQEAVELTQADLEAMARDTHGSRVDFDNPPVDSRVPPKADDPRWGQKHRWVEGRWVWCKWADGAITHGLCNSYGVWKAPTHKGHVPGEDVVAWMPM